MPLVVELLLAAYVGVIAAAFASFAGVCMERIPRGESINGRSRCVCSRPLRARDNIPVVSWALYGGRARCCSARIPAWYFLSETAAFAGTFLLSWLWSPVAALLVFLAVLFVTTVVVVVYRRRVFASTR